MNNPASVLLRLSTAFAALLVLSVASPAVAGEGPDTEDPLELEDLDEPSPADPATDPDQRQTTDADETVDEGDVRPTFDEHVDHQAAIEIELGLQLYNEGDDYRAITALKRHRLLAGDVESDHLTHLLIGDIYRRNDYPQLAIRHFWDGARFADELGTTSPGAYHLGVQEVCVTLGAYPNCHGMLEEIEASAAEADNEFFEELAAYQREFVEFVLRIPADGEPDFADPRLQRAAFELRDRNEVFDDLNTKSPVAAGILSALVPGAGQAYVGRWADAALAIGTTGTFAGATAYSHFGLENLPLTIISGVLTAGFYSGNIANAVVDARRHNAALYDDFFDSLHRDLWPRLRLRIEDNEVDYDYEFDWPGRIDLDDQTPEQPPIPDML